MQARAAEDLRKAVTDRLVAAGLTYDGAKAFVTPRRLALSVHGVPARQPDVREEKKGPRVGAPDNAIAGFLKAAGLKSISDAKVQPDKKGDFYVAVIEKPGRPALEVIGEILSAVIKHFPWPKSMRWGAQSKEPGALTWVRPLIPSSPRSDRRPRIRTSCHSMSTASPPATRARTPFPRAAAVHRAAARRLHGQARQGQGRARCRAAARYHHHRSQAACLCARTRTGRGRGAIGRSCGSRRMAGRADGLVRRKIFAHPRGSDPRHHPQQPEMLRAPHSSPTPPTPALPTSSCWSPTWRPWTAARKSSPATSASSAPGCRMRSFSTKPI